VKRAPAPFRHRNLGNLASIGRKEAVVDHGWIKVRGRVGSASRRWLPKSRTSAAAPGHEIYAYLVRDLVIETRDR